MYMLRVISAVLHQDVGPAVPDSALDLRLGELAVVVPLVLCLLGLSAYPNLISGHSFGGNKALVNASANTTMLNATTCTKSAQGGACQSVMSYATGPTLNIDQASTWTRYAP
jgi:hypothetical protein